MARKTGCPLSPNFDHHQFSDSVPVSSWSVKKKVEYHFFSDPSPRNDQRPAGNLFANKDTSVTLAIHSLSLSAVLQMMSLNIDMKIIRPWNCAGSPILFMNSWTFVDELQCGESWETFHSNSIGSPSIVFKVLYCGESLNQLNCSSQTVFDAGF